MINKITITAVLIFNFFNVFAQSPTAAEIKNKKIKKVTIYFEGETKDYNFYTEIYYDANGYDTAFYYNGKRWYYKKMQYNEQQKPIRIEEFAVNDSGKINVVETFVYNIDATSISNRVYSWGSENIIEYDKEGKIIKDSSVSSIIKYIYNKKGQLIKRLYEDKETLHKSTFEYKYDKKGKMIVKIFDDLSDICKTKVEYNREGLVSKETETYIQRDPPLITTQKYLFSY